jgi:transposase
VAELARAELADIMALTEQIKALEKRIAARVREAPDAMQGDVQLPIPRPGHL